jgi:hypothetical protein
MGILKRSTVALAAAVMLALPSAASAQLLTFYTSGFFTGGAGCTTSSCTFGGYTLNYSAAVPTTYLSPSTVGLGMFSTIGAGPASTLAGTTFTLEIHQLAPGLPNTGSFAGAISGTFQYAPNQSSLVWVPTQNTITLNTLPNYATTYKLVNNYDVNGVKGIAISPNGTSIEANAAVAPEPGTFVLFGSGLAIVGFFVRRRKVAALSA